MSERAHTHTCLSTCMCLCVRAAVSLAVPDPACSAWGRAAGGSQSSSASAGLQEILLESKALWLTQCVAMELPFIPGVLHGMSPSGFCPCSPHSAAISLDTKRWVSQWRPGNGQKPGPLNGRSVRPSAFSWLVLLESRWWGGKRPRPCTRAQR